MAEGRENMGGRFKRLREQAGFSQSGLAEATGIPNGTIKNWEQDRRVPRLDHAMMVAKALGISLDTLAGMDEPPPATPKRRGKK